MSILPQSVRLYAYQVGFGDCFLLTFQYPANSGERDRNVLIDFGSSGAPSYLGKDLMLRVAEDINKECGGRLDVVVASHRHSDHVSGFETSKKGDGSRPGDIIRACKPKVVMQPWTEDPKAKEDAKAPTKTLPQQEYLRALSGAGSFTRAMMGELDVLGRGLGTNLAAQLGFYGQTGLPNLSAVENLMTMGKNQYLYALSKLDLSDILPGVKLHVLGPPTVKQTDSITKQRTSDAAEFWLRQAFADQARAEGARHAFKGPVVKERPPYANWLIPKLQANRGAGLLELVRMLDSQMNNTSLVLLFEVGKQKLLFPGDAQIENWSYVLDLARNGRPALKRLLEGVTLYKVGHHGSRNATPKTLWQMFKNRGKPGKPGRLTTVVSTMPGKHGNEKQGTEVPRKALVKALSDESDYSTTQELKSKKDLRLEFTLNV